MTKKEMFEMTINILAETVAPEKEDLISGLQHEIELLNHKRSTPKGMTKTQKENEVLKDDIFAFVSENGAKRANDVAGYFGITVQKASALLNQMVKVQALEKVTEKKVNYFRVAEGV